MLSFGSTARPGAELVECSVEDLIISPEHSVEELTTAQTHLHCRLCRVCGFRILINRNK